MIWTLLFWGLVVVVAIATGVYFDIPFLRFLVPGQDIALVQIFIRQAKPIF